MPALPEYLEEQDEDTVRTRMLERIDDRYDKSEGGPIWDMQLPSVIEFALSDDRLRYVFDLGFIQETFGTYLDLKAEEHGVTRRAATAATGTLTIVADQGTVFPAGTEFSTEAAEGEIAQVYAIDDEVIIDATGTADVTATATTPGAAGNVGIDQIIVPVALIAGFTSVTNAGAFAGGTDIESDDDLRARLLAKVREPGTSGNRADYYNWALEVAGVGAVAVVPLEAGPGTVTVAILDANKDPASAALVADVQEYIAPDGANGGGRAPIGADVTVEAGAAVPVDVEATLTIDAGFVLADVQAAAEASIDDYLQSIAFQDDNDVRHARIVTAILDTPGVVDVTNVGIRTGAGAYGSANIPIGVKQVGTLGVVTWS